MPSLGLLLGAALLRIAVDTAGFYEVPADAVRGAGLDLAACDLTTAGGTETAVPIPIVEREDGGFEFWAALRPRHSRETVFVLRPREGAGAPAARVPSADAAPAAAVPGYYRVERNDVYDECEAGQAGVLASFGYGAGTIDYFYFGAPKQSQVVKIDLPPLPKGAAGTVPLRIAFQGDRTLGASSAVDLSWNGKPLGKVVRWAGPKPFTATLDVERAQVKESGNVLGIETRDGRIRLDWVELGFEEAPRAKAARKPLRVEKGAAADDLDRGGADWLAISVEGCRKALEPLAAHRAAQGLATRIVALQDVFDRFAGGNFDPRAIRRFIEHARKSWSPAPRYVLLCGEATYDVDWLGPRGAVLPAALVDTFDNGASATDNWFAAFDADRTVPDVAVGRFPTSDPKVVERLVARTIATEARAPMGPWRRKLSFVAGEGRFGPEIDRAIEDLALRIFNDYIPQGYELNMTYASPSSPYLYVPKKLTDKVVERMNEGAALINYTGHGARWGFDDLHLEGKRYPLFHSSDVPRVKCGERRPIVLITACWTGCFDYPKEEAVGELLFEHDAGAAAVFASSRISHPFSNAVLSKELVAALFGKASPAHPERRATAGSPESKEPNPERRLGDVLVDAKRRMLEAKDPYRDMINTYGLMFLADPMLLIRLLKDDCQLYNLFGDPALRLPFPSGAIGLEAKGKAHPGGKLTVAGTVPGMERGRAVVTFEVERRTIRGELEPVDLAEPGVEKRIVKNYETANDKVTARADVEVSGGAFEATLALPDDLLFVKHHLKAYAWSERADALGALEVVVEDEPE